MGGHVPEVLDLVRHEPRVELVRISTNNSGQLMYVGRDFFYKPQEALGAWLPLDVSALEKTGEALLRKHYMAAAVETFKSKRHYTHDRDSFVRFLTEKSWTSDYAGVEPALAETFADLAVAEGLLE